MLNLGQLCHLDMVKGGIQVLCHPSVLQNDHLLHFLLHVEHWNYLGVDETLGPVAVSLRREKLEDHKDHGPQHNYRVIFRTSEVSARMTETLLLVPSSL